MSHPLQHPQARRDPVNVPTPALEPAHVASRGFMLDEVRLYDASDSPFCLKARLCLHLKGVAFRRVTVTLGRRRELRRLNPLRKVPVLVEGTTVVTDSSRIGRYLDERYPEPPLLPKDPTTLAYAALLEEWADESLSFIIGAFKWVNPANRRAAVANTVTELTSGLLRPLVGRYLARALRRRYAAWGCGPEALGELHARMREHLAMLSTLVTERDFLLGRTATLADLATFTQLVWMQRYAEGALLAEFPLVTEWQQRVAEIPAVAAALSS